MKYKAATFSFPRLNKNLVLQESGDNSCIWSGKRRRFAVSMETLYENNQESVMVDFVRMTAQSIYGVMVPVGICYTKTPGNYCIFCH